VTSGSANITVNLSGISPQTVTVNYATSNGSATAGSDYTANSGTLTFAPGQTAQSFSVAILDDALFEGSETVNLALSNSANATIGTPGTAVLTITDNEGPPAAAFSSATYAVAENATSANITVNLSGSSLQTVTVNYATSNGSATAGADYTAKSGTLTFAPGQTTQSFSVTILDDAVFEGSETVNLALSNSANATIGTPGTAVLTITDNEGPPTVVATIRIEPQTLNLASNGDFTAFISLATGLNVRDIVAGTLRCEGAPAVRWTVANDKLVVKFERQSLVGVRIGESVIMTVTGRLVTGEVLSGSDIVSVTNK